MESSTIHSSQLPYGVCKSVHMTSLGIAAAILTTLGSLKAEPDYRAMVYEIESHRTPVAQKDAPVQHPPLLWDIARLGGACALLGLLLRAKRT